MFPKKSKVMNGVNSVNSIDSDEDSEHDLIYFANNRLLLMKEVLKLVKPAQIRAMAPTFMKDLDVCEINSALFEELLGISNKRLERMLNGGSYDSCSTSSSDSEHENEIDIISLDDISDTDDNFGPINSNKNNKDDKRTKKEKTNKGEIKTEKSHSRNEETNSLEPQKNGLESDKFMNVLEILELQARARAIRSQLALEHTNKPTEDMKAEEIIDDDDDDIDAIIVHSPRNEEIVITSESEEEKEKETKPIEKNENPIANDVNSSNVTIKETQVAEESCPNAAECNENHLAKKDTESESKPPNENNSEMAKESDLFSAKVSDSKSNNDNIYDKNNAGSDSDNDVINLDSEDIVN